jgi:hypothetical protein
MNPDSVFGNLPTARRHVVSVSLNEDATSTETGKYII